ncbi:MAG: 4'-phosphopantetheinyl transferase family protein [Vulcanococcus sp.]
MSRLLHPPTHYWLRPLTAPGEGVVGLSRQEQAWAERLPLALQARYRASRRLLRQCVAPLLGLAADALPLHSPPGEAPRLAHGHGHVSLSHSGGQLLLAWSPAPIGVDLEWAQRPVAAAALARRFYPPQEAARLLALPAADQPRALLESWVRKEAAIKWQGSSLAADLRHWLWDADGGQLRHLLRGWAPPALCREWDGWLCGAVGDAAEAGIWG